MNHMILKSFLLNSIYKLVRIINVSCFFKLVETKIEVSFSNNNMYAYDYMMKITYTKYRDMKHSGVMSYDKFIKQYKRRIHRLG